MMCASVMEILVIISLLIALIYWTEMEASNISYRLMAAVEIYVQNVFNKGLHQTKV